MVHRRFAGMTAAFVVLVGFVPAAPVHAFQTMASFSLPTGRLYYTIDPSFTQAGYLPQSLWAAEQGWKIQGLAGHAEFWNDPNGANASRRKVNAGYIDGPGSIDAQVNYVGCVLDCLMTFEPGTGLWNTTTEVRDDSWLDFVGIATHEFGHWLGLHHWNRFPASDNGAISTMEGPRSTFHAKPFRTIQADDVNGLRAARATSPSNLAANGSFEYASPGWGGTAGQGWLYRRAGTAGSAARYCNGSVHGSCFMEFNGGGTAGSSLFQDIIVPAGNYVAGRSTTVRARLRSPAFLSSVTVVVWALDPAPVIVYQRTCSLPAGTWIELSSTTIGCTGQIAFNEPTTSDAMRVEIYNNHANHNLDVDDVRLQF